MKIIISESQSKKLITESIGSEMGSTFKKGFDFIKEMIEIASIQVGTNLQFMLTWGAGIAGFMGPITDFVKNEYPELDDIQLSLIVTSLIATYYFENRKITKELFKKIQDEGLSGVFKKILRKSDTFINVFSNFIKSLSPTIHSMLNMMSYTFLIPILPMIYNSIDSGMVDKIDFDQLTKMLIGFSGLTLSSILVKKLLLLIAERFKTK